jgi:hypothetical protein
VAGLNGLIDCLARNEGTDETTGECIASTVGINDLVVGEGSDGVPLRLFLVRRNDNGGLGTLGEDNNTRAGRVGLGESSDVLRDTREVLRVRKAVRSSPRLSLRLVSDEEIGVRDDLLELGTEELSDERRGEVEDEGLASGSGLAAQLERGLDAVSEEEAFDVVELGALDEGGDGG